MIDKTNKLWKWSKPSKKFKDQYREMCGLEANELGMMTDKAWNSYMDIFRKTLNEYKR